MDIRFKTAERLSHACIISAADMAEALDTAKSIAAAAVCRRGFDVPCMQCRDCRKARDGVHPDIILIERLKDDKGGEKKEISVDQVRDMAADACILPNEAERKVYIIKDADRMNTQAQNAALKLLEEPPKTVIFLLCVQNSDRLLETVRSRCAEMLCSGSAEERDEATEKLAEAYIKTVSSLDRAKLFSWCTKNEELGLREAADFCDCVQELCADMLAGRKSSQGLKPDQLLHIAALMRRCGDYLRVNVGVKHIFGLLAVKSVRSGDKKQDQRTIN